MQARTRHTDTQQGSAKSHQNEDSNAKKELKEEIADIRVFSLMFDNEAMEAKWNRQYMNRHISITTRYLFAATVFQGLFYWSDVLESDKDPSSLFHLLCLRLLIGGFTLLGCFLVSTGLVVPTQLTVFWVNLCYGFPSLAIFYLARPAVSVYDSFFLVYGLCFFMLPKISPLNFIFGFSGALLFTFLFIYISAFRLSFQQWLLSNTFLMVIVLLFCYISYSAERVSRERWLLRERLKRERINLRIVASSIQDDFTKAANDERPFPLDSMRYSINPSQSSLGQSNFRNLSYDQSTGKAIRLLATLGGGMAGRSNNSIHSSNHSSNPSSNDLHHSEPDHHHPLNSMSTLSTQNTNHDSFSHHTLHNTSSSLHNNHTPSSSSVHTNNNHQHNQTLSTSHQKAQSERVALFFRSLVGWALCYGMGYAFDFVATGKPGLNESDNPAMRTKPQYEINSSAAFALLMHSMGFSVFLMLFTGQIRWLALNGIVGLALMWVFNQTGMDNKWVVFSTHSVGYVLLAVVIIIMILVFGGVVLVWSHLIDFLKEVLVRYPHVKDAIPENKILEQVLVRYLADMPKTKSLYRPSTLGASQIKSNGGGGVEEKDDGIVGGGNVSSSASQQPSHRPHVLQVYRDFDSDEEEQQSNYFTATAPTATATAATVHGITGTGNNGGTTSNAQSQGLHRHPSNNNHHSNNNNNHGGGNKHLQSIRSKAAGKGQEKAKSLTDISSSSSSSMASFVASLPQHTHASTLTHASHGAGGSHHQGVNNLRHLRILDAKRPGSCFFCLKPGPTFLVPACSGWTPQSLRPPTLSDESNPSTPIPIPMCTPYTEMLVLRDDAVGMVETFKTKMHDMESKFHRLENERNAALATVTKMQGKLNDMELAMRNLRVACETAVRAQQQQRDLDVQTIVTQHNQQMAELKRLHQALAASSSSSSSSLSSPSTAATTATSSLQSTASGTKGKNPSTTTISGNNNHNVTTTTTTNNNNTNTNTKKPQGNVNAGPSPSPVASIGSNPGNNAGSNQNTGPALGLGPGPGPSLGLSSGTRTIGYSNNVSNPPSNIPPQLPLSLSTSSLSSSSSQSMFSGDGAGAGGVINTGAGPSPSSSSGMYANNAMVQGPGLGPALGPGLGSDSAQGAGLGPGLLPYGLFSSGGGGNRGIVDLMDDINVQGFWTPSQPALSSQLPSFSQQSGSQPPTQLHSQTQPQFQSQLQSQFWGVDSYSSTMGTPSFLPSQDVLSPQMGTFGLTGNYDIQPLNINHSTINDNQIIGNHNAATIITNNIHTNTTNNTNNLDYEEIQRLILAELAKPTQSNF